MLLSCLSALTWGLLHSSGTGNTLTEGFRATRGLQSQNFHRLKLSPFHKHIVKWKEQVCFCSAVSVAEACSGWGLSRAESA